MGPRFAFLTLLLFAIPPAASEPAQPPLAVSIRLSQELKQPTIDFNAQFSVILTNNSSGTIRIWKPSSFNGLHSISFQFKNTRTGHVDYVHIRPDVDPRYLRHDSPESTVEIDPGDSYVTNHQFDRKLWADDAWLDLPTPNSNDLFQVISQVESTIGIDSSSHPIWTGKIQSPPIITSFTAARLKNPQSYLESRFPEEGLRLAAANPQQLDYNQLLGSAVRFGHVKAINWLLEKGADVNARLENQSTALELAEDPDIVELLLHKHPNVSLCSMSPLQHAARNSTEDWRIPGPEQWRKIAQVYLKHGLEYDFLSAIYLDDLNRVKEILNDHPEYAKTFSKRNPLRIAVEADRLSICKELIENHEVDLNDWEGGSGFPIILSALEKPELFKLLVEHGADIKSRITLGSHGGGFGRTGPPPTIGEEATILHYSAERSVPETVTLLLNHNLNIFATANNDFDLAALSIEHRQNPHQFPLELAASAHKGDNAKAILTHPNFQKSDPALRQFILDKCLRIAITSEYDSLGIHQPSAIVPLLAAGANPNAKHDGITMMQLVAEYFDDLPDHSQIIEAFKKHDAVIDLHIAAAIGDHAEVQNALRKDPQSVNHLNHHGELALHPAARRGFHEIAATLIAAGANVNLPVKSPRSKHPEDELDEIKLRYEGFTPLHYASSAGHLEIAILLINAGADVNVLTRKHDSPLHLAAWGQHIGIAKLLLQKGAKPDVRNSDNETPLETYREVAEHNDGPDLARLFQDFQAGRTK